MQNIFGKPERLKPCLNKNFLLLIGFGAHKQTFTRLTHDQNLTPTSGLLSKWGFFLNKQMYASVLGSVCLYDQKKKKIKYAKNLN